MNDGPRNRRAFFGRAGAVLAALGFGGASARAAPPPAAGGRRVVGEVVREQDVPLFSSAVAHGNVLYLAGKGAHFEGDIRAHTDHVLTELQRELEKHGSSMDKVLKVNVYLADLADYAAMNDVFRGRFGAHPPVRTTVACYGGIPGDSLVEIDCIAALE